MNEIIRIFHLSDIHFGKFNNFPRKKKTEQRYGTPNGLMDLLTQSDEKEKPHIIIISGDLTSVGSADDFKEFLGFIDKIVDNNCLRKVQNSDYTPKDRIIIVPGNHDVARTKTGNDKLHAFKKFIVKNNFNTPFENKNLKFQTVTGKNKIPNSIYFYPDFNLSFHCIVSCYFSGGLPDEYKEAHKLLLKAKRKNNEKSFYKPAREMLEKIMRNDRGFLEGSYINSITETDKDAEAKIKNSAKFCVMHHNVDASEACTVIPDGAEILRENLFHFGYEAILHGHIHQIVDHLPKFEHLTTALSCGTFSGNTSTGLSFNIIDVHPKAGGIKGKMDIYEMRAEGNKSFSWRHKRKIYEKITS